MTYTITVKLTRSIPDDWTSAVDNGFHVGVTPREALRKQLTVELQDAVEAELLGAENIEVLSLYGPVDHLTEADAFDDSEEEAA